MNAAKTKSITNIEQKMEALDADTLRYRVLECAKSFKVSWIDLGQALYTVYKDKMFKNWGYTTFDVYTAKEIGIKKQTAFKLLRSYYFLEREEPLYLKRDHNSQDDTAKMPSFESVDLLRLAKNNKQIDKDEYENIRSSVLEKGRDAREVKKDLTALIRQREELDPDEAREKRKHALLRRLLGSLRTINDQVKSSNMLPVQVIKDIEKLIGRLEQEI